MSARLRPTLAAPLAALVLLAGCGGGGDGKPDPNALLSLGDTQSCLDDEGLETSTSPKQLGFIAGNSPAGGLRVNVGGNSATIAFGNTRAEGRRLEVAFRRFAGNKKRVKNLLERRNNAVVTWLVEPAANERKLLSDCLR